jgi:acetolactate synthase I/II/III large subunit
MPAAASSTPAPRRRELLTELRAHDGLPCTNTLMGLGAFPASDPQFLGMLGMHGTYEANLAMHGCDVMLNIGARFDDRVTGRLNAFSPNSKKIHVDIDPPRSTRTCGGRAHRRRRRLGAGALDGLEGAHATARQEGARRLVAQIDEWRARDCLRFKQTGKIIKPQYAVKRLYELTKDSAARPSSPPRSASTRCGRRSISASRSRTAG